MYTEEENKNKTTNTSNDDKKTEDKDEPGAGEAAKGFFKALGRGIKKAGNTVSAKASGTNLKSEIKTEMKKLTVEYVVQDSNKSFRAFNDLDNKEEGMRILIQTDNKEIVGYLTEGAVLFDEKNNKRFSVMVVQNNKKDSRKVTVEGKEYTIDLFPVKVAIFPAIETKE